MNLIIEMIGGRGVGKSTVISGIKQQIKNCISREGFRKINTNYDLSLYEEFLENERLYLIREIQEMKKLKEYDGIVFVTRGPRELLMYLDYIIKSKPPEWQKIYSELNSEIQMVRTLFPDNYIYIYSSDDKLKNNIMNDTKKRNNTEFWLEFNRYERNVLMDNDSLYYIDAENLDSDALKNEVLKYLEINGVKTNDLQNRT